MEREIAVRNCARESIRYLAGAGAQDEAVTAPKAPETASREADRLRGEPRNPVGERHCHVHRADLLSATENH
jgi:hypothetical protein